MVLSSAMRVTVFCASSQHASPSFFEAARRLGTGLAREGHHLVYGGGSVGLMGAIADSAQEAGGVVHGIITRKLVDLEQARPHCDTFEIVDDMRRRRQRMEELAEAFVVLPGGIGTYEELFEALVARILGEHRRPIILINVEGYFEPLLALLRHTVESGLARPAALSLMRVAGDAEEALRMLREVSEEPAHCADDLIPSRAPGAGR